MLHLTKALRHATDFSPPRGSLLNPNRRSDCNRVGNSHFRSSLFRSKLLSLKSESLFKKEWHEWFTHFLRANRTFALKKQVICPPKFVVFAMFFLQFFTAFPICMPKSESLPSLFAPSLFFKEWIAILLFCTQKTSDTHKKPKSEFPTLDLKLLWQSWQWNNVYHLPHISDPAVGELLQAIALAGTLWAGKQ